jgi:glycosyltransferase involved in cell wall biosynthesis
MVPINQLGYGIAGLNILKALQAHTDVSLHMIGQPQVTNQQDADAVTGGLEVAKTFDPNAPCVKIWHQNQMAEFIGHGEHVGFPIFELDTFNQLERHHLKSCDRLFVCSEWAKDVLYNQDGWTSPQVDVIPLGVDTDIFKPVEPIQRDKTIFFNCGKWEVRKGHDILIEAFKKVADKYDNVELWMMCQNPFNSPEEEHTWTSLYSHPKIKIIPRADTQQEVYNIMKQVDCGVFPSRGEGWNLELLEMMATGKHVIATGYSAHTEFCTKDNCSIIPITEKEPAFDGKWFFGQGNWAKIDDSIVQALQCHMENFIENDNRRTINEEGVETAKQFSWHNTASEIIKNV